MPAARRRMLASLMVCASLLLAGCTAAPAGPAPATTPPASDVWKQPATVSWTTDARLMSDVTVADAVALAYVSIGADKEQLTAWDAKTGTRLWRHDAAPGFQSPAVPHDVATVRHGAATWAAFLAPAPAGANPAWSTLSVVDVATGKPVAPRLAEQLIFSSRPVACGTTFCVTGTFGGEHPAIQSLQFSPATGMLEPAPASGAGGRPVPFISDGTPVGTFMSVSGGPGGQTLQFGADGRIRWTRPYTDVFGPGTGLAGGWAWADGDEKLPVVGFGNVAPVDHAGTPPRTGERRSLTTGRLVGLNRSTGATVWSVPGIANCPMIGFTPIAHEGVITACRIDRGYQTADWTGSTMTNIAFHDVRADVVGLDAKTGKVLWSIPVDADQLVDAWSGDASASVAPFAVSETPVVLIDGHAVAIDPVTGRRTALPAHATLLCQQPGRRSVPLAGGWDGGAVTPYTAATTFVPCTTAGLIRPHAKVSYGTLAAAGHDTGAISVVNLAGGVTAFAPWR